MSAQPRERLVEAEAVRDAPLHIVLVEPLIPANTGNVARLCAATGCALHLVEPLGFAIDDRELKRAGLDYWDALQVVVHPGLDALREVFAPDRMWLIETDGSRPYTEAVFARGDALIFGQETAGLPAAFRVEHRDRALRIPMREGLVRSINLSTSAGIVAYAALAALGFPEMT